MKHLLFFSFLVAIVGAGDPNSESIATIESGRRALNSPENMLTSMSMQDLRGFNWFNYPKHYSISDGILKISPGDTTDFFNDASTGNVVATAPMLFKTVAGNFVATAKVKPDFKDVWNACALMVYQDSLHWGKLCYENSDVSGPTVVTVVTDTNSDDANGPIVSHRETLWLRLARKDHIFAMYWSLDGEEFTMTRIFALPADEEVAVGMVAQCPAGKSVVQEFHFFSLEKRTLNDMRQGE